MDNTSYNRASVYLEQTNELRKPKYMFECLYDLIEQDLPSPNAPFSLLDVGSAAGEFIYFAHGRFPSAQLTGVEFDCDLLLKSQELCPFAAFLNDDANHLRMVPDKSFDYIAMTGVLSVFDEFIPALSSCIRVARPGAQILITGIFNVHPIDCRIYWNYSRSKNETLNRGYNLFSMDSVSGYLAECSSVKSWEFRKFELPFELAPRISDPIRSWTETSSNGSLSLRNGIMPLDFYHLIINLCL